ncbi:hypothetical protein JS530_00590 [Bifidobacterium sp. LC6]|uniref:Tubuliform spidroin n=1 Tax=Bifidobacterium colobi TaxID=2809026 RepID=A0ABS5USV7_9BIFI|nr:hypothetical protein [Bifidobacterium colobi]MBT1174029.1 hypothetical protein [Bifidobacterium colobi]
MKLTAAVLSCALCTTGAVGGAWLVRPPEPDYAAELEAASSIYAVTDAQGEPSRFYAVKTSDSTQNNSAAMVSRVPQSEAQLPWNVSVTYSLDGPNVEAEQVSNASGLVGVHITVRPQQTAGKTANRSVPVVAFTIPSQVASDVSADDNVTVNTQGTTTVIAATGHAAAPLDFNVYMNAKHFTMSALALAILPSDSSAKTADPDQHSQTQSDTPAIGAAPDAAGTAAAPNNGQQSAVEQLTANASMLVDSLTDAGSGEHQQLVDQLKALRTNEQQLAQTVTSERAAAHKQTFQNYMAAYVGSYTTHLSGSLGTSTQLPALVGTAGELSGDTPLAQAVLDLANAVNNVSAAHMHDGAVDALDEVIRRIQQQGTTGLTDDLTKEAAEEATKGAQQYAAGQKQLSAAMIPYSMKYTDVYTAKLSALTGGSSTGATAYAQQAIDETNNSDELKDSQAKVDAAMAALAAASEHTGKSQALKQILLRFADQFESDDDSATSASKTAASDNAARILTQGLADPQSQSFYGKAKAATAQRKAAAARKQAQAAQRQQSQDAGASLVDDTMSMAASDVMSYANGLTSALGTGGKSSAADSSSHASSAKKDANSSNKTTDATADNSTDAAPVLFGLRQSDSATLLTHDMSTLISETVEIGDAGQLIAQAATQLNSTVTSRQPDSSTPSYLIVVPTV